MKKAVITFIPMFLFAGMSAQTVDYGTNVPRSGDVLTRLPLEYFHEGDDGDGVVWDFSSLSDDSDSDGEIEVECFTDPDSDLLSLAGSDAVLRLSCVHDTLLVVGRETPLELIRYDIPQTVLTYPFSYGSSVSGPYEGRGTYSSRLNVRVSGSVHVESDAAGIIITESCDTLCGVLRVHTVRTGSVGMYAVTDSLFSDTSHVKQEIEERYEWYVRGCRYPLYETSSVTYYDDMTRVSCIRSASRISPDCVRLPDDPVNDSILAAAASADQSGVYGRSSATPDGIVPSADIIHYTTSMVGGTLLLEYSLDSDATLTFIVCNKMGMLFSSRRERAAAGSDMRMEFDCGSLPPNDYILYINVNGMVYSETFKVE